MSAQAATRPPLYVINRQVTDDAGKPVPAKIEDYARVLVQRFPAYSLYAAREAAWNFARFEQDDVARKIAANAAWEQKQDRDGAEISRLADTRTAEQLEFEINRRAFGSFTTTIDGSPERQAIYRAALARKSEMVPA